MQGRHLGCRFATLDFLTAPPPDGPFQFVFDRGCFHVFDEPGERQRFAAQVAAVLTPGGVWLSLVGSTEGPPREVGPPRRSAREVILAIEPVLEIVELRSAAFRERRKGVVLSVTQAHRPGAAVHAPRLSRPKRVPRRPMSL